MLDQGNGVMGTTAFLILMGVSITLLGLAIWEIAAWMRD